MGFLNNYIGNVLANRAYSLMKIEFKDKWKHYWRCAQLPHGFDGDNHSFEKYTIKLCDSSTLFDSLSNSFDSEWESKYEVFPEEVKKHPLFEATEAIGKARGHCSRSLY